MRGRSPIQSLAASPTMVGAVTTLIVIVAVFLAYNANSGLPFVPVYRVAVEVPDASRLTNNNEVRIGGHRVGVVESIAPVIDLDATATAQADRDATTATETGGVIARLNLKLDKSAEPLPKDSVFRVRYRSSFGLKYLEIVRGTGEAAPEGFTFDGTDDGDVCELPVDPESFSANVSETASNGCFQQQTEFDDINNTFDNRTREAARDNLQGFGDGFAGRGMSLNDAVENLEPLFRSVKPVAEVLTEPDTRFERFFPELGDAARIVAPVAEEQALLFAEAAVAFAAISSDVAKLQETISEGPPTLETAIDTLPRQRPFLRDFALLSRELRPGVTDLRATLPVLNSAIEVGTPVLRRSPEMNRLLRNALQGLDELVEQPTTKLSIQRLGDTFGITEPFARTIVPAQTVCNYLGYWFTFWQASFVPDQLGYTWLQALAEFPLGPLSFDVPVLGPQTLPGMVETPVGGYSGEQANGIAGPLPNPADAGVFKPYELPILNAPAYGPAGQDGSDCQAGQIGYKLGELLAPGQDPSNPGNAVVDLPGSRGPTTLFFNDNQDRELYDSRVASRQPGTWEDVK
ncbi:MAG TPA: MlaD family protein [Solirubrobacterales bacterium]|jgi:ABC-type transporter Mla subunit MlaD|nr:MlaD family protein [Solirubrobacterales bacterium]